jgi:hypothetical protein
VTGQSAEADSGWKELYKVGGLAALIVPVLVVSEIALSLVYPQPSTVAGWFALFQSNAVVGVFDFWGWEIPMYVLFAMIFLALYVVLRKANEGRMAVAAALGFLGVGIFLATTNPVSMLSFSNQYAAATTDAQKSLFLSAGQAVFTNTNQRAIGGFNLGLFLVSMTGLVMSSVMLQSDSFSRSTAYLGILGNVLSLADYLREALAPPETVALLVIFSGALFLMTWLVLVGRRLWQLGGHDGTKTEVKQG